ncbi:hypothetical protein [Psychromicrobium xiongbiense]|uniref:hypothetical protein n=1 Tax=Psychromicrobium xiongbiense TaxID=3051184 RepID=UPI0025526ABF|nr:hypothetical protein [Psychromicrobium sp. YIM S02556]
MSRALPDALVRDYQSLIPAMTCDPKDRHVLAAAVRSSAKLIVTFNIRDFPQAAVEPFDIDVVDPDDFLLDQLDLYPEMTLTCIQNQASDYANPQITQSSLLDAYQKIGLSQFAAEVRARTEPGPTTTS